MKELNQSINQLYYNLILFKILYNRNCLAQSGNNPVEYYDPSGYAKTRKNREPRKNIVSCSIDSNTGKRTYVLKYKDKYLQGGKRKDKTFEISYDKDLQALFKEHPEYLYNNGGKGSKVELPNGFSGNRDKDFREANRINKRDNLINEQPKDYTWEHDRDKKSLYLVRTDVHDSTPHTGGHSLKLQELDNETKSAKTTKKNKKDSKQGKSSTKGCGGKGRTMK